MDRLRSILADDVSFRGPLAEIDGADEYAASIRGLFSATGGSTSTMCGSTARTCSPGLTSTCRGRRRHRWPSGAMSRTAGPRVQVTFDPRGILAAG